MNAAELRRLAATVRSQGVDEDSSELLKVVGDFCGELARDDELCLQACGATIRAQMADRDLDVRAGGRALALWARKSPSKRVRESASRLWLLTGFLPPYE